MTKCRLTSKVMKPKLLVVAIGAFFLSLGLALAIAPFFTDSVSPASLAAILSRNFLEVSRDSRSSGGLAARLAIRAYIVQSGSMTPAIGVGSLVVTLPQSTYQSTDVVTFVTDPKGKNITTHRIAFKTYPDGPGGAPVYITKGDKNEEIDTVRITDQNIIGRVFLTIPYIGYAAVFMKEPWGFILLVIVPATIIIYEELKTLFRELKKFFKKFVTLNLFQGLKRKRMLNPFGLAQGVQVQRATILMHEVPATHKEFPKVVAVIPVVAATLLVLSATSAFFGDKEASLGNIFSAATSYVDLPLQPLNAVIEPSPTPAFAEATEGKPSATPSPSSSPAPSLEPTPEATPSVEPTPDR